MSEINILQPKNCNFSQIKHDFTQSADQIIDIATYPKTITTADKVSVETSKPFNQDWRDNLPDSRLILGAKMEIAFRVWAISVFAVLALAFSLCTTIALFTLLS